MKFKKTVTILKKRELWIIATVVLALLLIICVLLNQKSINKKKDFPYNEKELCEGLRLGMGSPYYNLTSISKYDYVNQSIISSGKKGYILTGPNINLIEGMYKIKIELSLLEQSESSDITFLITANNNRKEVLERLKIEDLNENEIQTVTMELLIEEAYNNVDLRVFADEGCVVEIFNVVITKEE